jgi:N-acetylglutamate synthase-like GNAT family acetyltransferase
MNTEQCKANVKTYKYEIAVSTAVDAEGNLAHEISDWTHGEHMLPKTPEEIGVFMKQKHSIVIYAHHEPIGHAAITYKYQSLPQAEIGSIVVHPNWRRGKSVGTIATMAILDHSKDVYPNDIPIALDNTQSKALFISMGAKEMNTEEVDPEAWVFCNTCPKRPMQPENGKVVCCDTPYDLSPLMYPENLYYQLWVHLKMTLEKGKEDL